MRPGNVAAARQPRRVRLTEVAARAGVHPGTASRALSADRRLMVGQETMQRVLRAAADLGYEPDLLARGLRTQRSFTVGVLIPGLDDLSVLPLLRGAEEALAGAGYAALIASIGGNREAVLARMRTRHVDGLIIAGRLYASAPPSAWPSALPVVVAGGPSAPPGVPAAAVDHELGARLIRDHLLRLGHRRIGRITRAEASTAREAARCTRRLVGEGCTAIAASSDLLAAGALTALAGTGRRCPRDVTVTGYGDTPLSTGLAPALTTVRLPYFEVGREAAALLLTEITDVTPVAGTRQVAPELVIRASSGPAGPSPDR